MAQDVAQAVLMCLVAWVVVTAILWVITGLVGTWKESNEILRAYVRAWSTMWSVATVLFVIFLATGVLA